MGFLVHNGMMPGGPLNIGPGVYDGRILPFAVGYKQYRELVGQSIGIDYQCVHIVGLCQPGQGAANSIQRGRIARHYSTIRVYQDQLWVWHLTDQGRIWTHIAEKSRRMNFSSPTRAMSDVFDHVAGGEALLQPQHLTNLLGHPPGVALLIHNHADVAGLKLERYDDVVQLELHCLSAVEPHGEEGGPVTGDLVGTIGQVPGIGLRDRPKIQEIKIRWTIKVLDCLHHMVVTLTEHLGNHQGGGHRLAIG